jgi:hypothetical protein
VHHLNFHEKLYALKLELNIETPHWSYILLAVQVYIQRTVLGLASSKAGHGCQRYYCLLYHLSKNGADINMMQEPVQ